MDMPNLHPETSSELIKVANVHFNHCCTSMVLLLLDAAGLYLWEELWQSCVKSALI